MAVADGRTVMEHLSEEECWTQLAAAPFGRVGVLVDSAPEVYPVLHALDGRSIVFRTDDGTKLRGIDRSPSVCFEADGVDLEAMDGWSVLVKGRAVEIASEDERRIVEDLPLRFWSSGSKSHWIRITPHEITGRRIAPMRRNP